MCIKIPYLYFICPRRCARVCVCGCGYFSLARSNNRASHTFSNCSWWKRLIYHGKCTLPHSPERSGSWGVLAVSINHRHTICLVHVPEGFERRNAHGEKEREREGGTHTYKLKNPAHRPDIIWTGVKCANISSRFTPTLGINDGIIRSKRLTTIYLYVLRLRLIRYSVPYDFQLGSSIFRWGSISSPEVTIAGIGELLGRFFYWDRIKTVTSIYD